MGCSLAYHPTLRGWRDVVLLERKQLTSGTTWQRCGSRWAAWCNSQSHAISAIHDRALL
ncbi:hypothetical protein BcanWU425_32990 [Bradyrhizobium sp. WU425]|nr:hypothetical protein BcanWU425_32990 [Bradyrhizobium canariense]